MVDYDEVLSARERVPAEADRLRRLGLSRARSTRPVPRDRRRGRRAPDVRHGPLLRAGRRRPPPEPGRALRLRHLDDAQDPGGAALGLHPLPEEYAQAVDKAVFPGDAGRPARHAIAGQGHLLQDRRVRRVPRLPGAGADERGRARRDARRTGLDVLTGGTDTHLLRRPPQDGLDGKEAEERLHELKLTVNRNTIPFDERPPTVAPGFASGRRP